MFMKLRRGVAALKLKHNEDGLCGDTTMLQNDIRLDMTDLENADDFQLGMPDEWSVTDMEKEALRQISLMTVAAYNTTPVSLSVAAYNTTPVSVGKTTAPLVAAIQSGSNVSNVAKKIAENTVVLNLDLMSTNLIWVFLIAAALLGLGCVFCMVRTIDRGTVEPPPLIDRGSKKKTGRSRPGPAVASASSLGVPESATSLRSARSGISVARSSRAGRGLAERVRGRESSKGPSAAQAKSRGAARGTPATTPVSKQFTFSTAEARGSTNQAMSKGSLNGPRKTGDSNASNAGDCRFTVPVDTLVEVADAGSFNIKDIASGLLLKVTLMRNAEGQKTLQLFLGPEAPKPCTTVGPPKPDSRSDPESLDMCGPNGQTFGNLTLQGNGSFIVSAQGQPMLVIEGNEADLDLRISSRDGRLVGAVSCNDANFSGAEHVEFRVLPGTDPVLVVSCILAVLFLCGDDETDGD